LRVIAGTARGTRLKAPRGFNVRPTADRVKEALFSIIASRVPGSRFIDLYAGSGAIGIEALSRGACFCIFVDRRKENLALIKENLAKTRLEGSARLLLSDAQKALTALSAEEEQYDLVYLDPPYSMTDPGLVVTSVITGKVISDDGLIIVEHARSNRQWAERFEGIRQKVYGDTCLTFIPAR
jgi:16S rRNA (guanine966-N2)-methyltransferase